MHTALIDMKCEQCFAVYLIYSVCVCVCNFIFYFYFLTCLAGRIFSRESMRWTQHLSQNQKTVTAGH